MPNSIASLNIRLGLLTRDFNRQLRQVERDITRTGRRLSEIGDRLTIGLTVPILGMGAAALKSAGDLESLKLALETTFKNNGRTIQEAAIELDKLQAAARAPGLDFEQAIKGSVRLQNVGIAAEDAREILIQLANAVASAGGTAQELDSVTRQFSQMISKGRILQEDLTIISENMPGIAKAMEDAFGTKSAEELRKLGITAEQFITGVTKQLAGLDRVPSGIKNALVNAGVAIRIQLSRVGETINEAFDVSGAVDAFIAAMTGVVDLFVEMDPVTRKVALSILGIVAAVGPLVKVMGLLKLAQGAIVGSFGELIGAGNKVIIFAQRAAIAFRALGAAQQALVLGGLLIALKLIADELGVFERRLTASEKAANSLRSITQKAANDIVDEKVRLTQLIGTLKDENSTRLQKETALASLQRIAPAYFKNLKLEEGQVKGLTAAANRYTEALVAQAKVRAATSRLAELERVRLNIADEADPSLLQQIGNALLGVGQGAAVAALNADTFGKNWVRITDEIDAEEKVLTDLIAKNRELAESLETTVEPFQNLNTETKKNTEETEKQRKARENLAAATAKLLSLQSGLVKQNATQFALSGGQGVSDLSVPQVDPGSFIPDVIDSIDAVARSAQDSISDVVSSLRDASGQGQQFVETTQGFGEAMQSALINASIAADDAVGRWGQIGLILKDLNEGTVGFNDTLSAAIELLNESGRGLEATFLTMTDAMANAFATAEGGFKSMALAAVASGAKVIKVAIQEGVAKTVASALESVPFPFNLAIAAVAGGAAAALFSKAIGAIGIPALASGGAVFKPTVAVVGDNPNSATDPEIIAPESRIRNIFESSQGMMQGELVARVTGDQILFVWERAQKRQTRTRG